jgi:hypothetical protein
MDQYGAATLCPLTAGSFTDTPASPYRTGNNIVTCYNSRV